MKASLQTRLSQQLTLTPQLQQAIKLLQLSQQELNEEIEEYLANNPLLEIVEDPDNDHHAPQLPEQPPENSYESFEPAEGSDEVIAMHADETNWQDYGARTTTQDDDGYKETFDIKDQTGNSLRDHLYWQMNLTPFNEKDYAIALAIIDEIDEHGYLVCTLAEIQACLGNTAPTIHLDEIQAVLHRIQQFDPIGVGARNLTEYLLIQLEQYNQDTPGLKTAQALIENNIDLLAKTNTKAIKEAYQLSDLELANVLALIKNLSPRPSYFFSGGLQVQFILPDVVVKKRDGNWIVELNDDLIPKLQINPQMMLLTDTMKNKDVSKELREQFQDAKWFLKSIENRQDTLRRVAACIVLHQQEFLEKGDIAMKPMILQDVAQLTELHESTISRITSNKYMQTPVGIYELKYFFSSHVMTKTGQGCSSTAIRAMIKQLIANEPGAKPLSDSKIVSLLKETQGINIARRTITKYREAMRIPASHERKILKPAVSKDEIVKA